MLNATVCGYVLWTGLRTVMGLMSLMHLYDCIHLVIHTFSRNSESYSEKVFHHVPNKKKTNDKNHNEATKTLQRSN